MNTVSDICEEIVSIRGNGRALEGVLAYSFGQTPAWSAVIAGPHPLLGGDLHNNVMHALSRGLAGCGAAALTFNYGGVGASEGGPVDWPAAVSTFWNHGRLAEECDWVVDTAHAIETLRSWCARPLVLVGYSFGCWTVSENARTADARAVVLISPNPNRHAFDGLNGCGMPLYVVHSDNDFSCNVDQITEWFEGLREPKTRSLVPAGEHFFRGNETELTRTVANFLGDHGIVGATRHGT